MRIDDKRRKWKERNSQYPTSTNVLLLFVIVNMMGLSTAFQLPRKTTEVLHRSVRQTPAGEKVYDQCSHPFHSFLCNPAPKPRTVAPEGSASFNVKQVVKPAPIIAAPSFGVKTFASPPPSIRPDPSSNIPRLIIPKSFPSEGSIEEPSTVNCQQHNTIVKAPITSPTTPKTIIIVGESSFARESKLPPEPYLPPDDSPSPAPTFLEPQRLDPPFSPIVQKVKPILEGQAANTPISIIPKDNEVNNCKHSFHSFLCSPTSRNKVPSTTPKSAPDLPLRGDSTFVRPEKVLPPQPKPFSQSILQPTKRPVPTTRTTTYRPITTTTRRIPVSTLRNAILAEAAQTPIQVATPQINKQPNICNDPFHSFLCQPVNTQKRKQKYGERNPSSTIPNSPASLRGDSSFVQQSIAFPNFNQPRTIFKPPVTTPKPTTTFRPYFILQTTSTTQNPFYFCNHTSTTVSPVTPSSNNNPRTFNFFSTTTKNPFSYSPVTQRPGNIKADSSFNQPTRIPFPSTTPKTTTLRTTTVRIPDPPVRIPAAQTPDVTIVRPDNGHNHDHDHGHGHGHDHDHGHHHIDICKDPFHSFLCTPVEPSKRKRPTGEFPARFKNPVPSNLVGASSFNSPTKVFPERTIIQNVPTTIRTTPKPTTTLRTTTRTPFTSRQFEIQPQPAQIHQIKLLPKPESSKKAEPCEHSFHSFLYNQNRKPVSSTETPFKAENTFLSPSKILPAFPLIAQGTDNKASIKGYEYPKPDQPLSTSTPLPGYVYNKPKNQLQYPKTPLAGESTSNQPSKVFPSNTFDSQATNNQPGYNYEKPSNPLPIPTTLPTTRKPPQNIFGQGSDNQENPLGYTYPKPPANQQFPTPKPGNNLVSTTTASGYKYPSPLSTPFTNTFIGAGSQISVNKTPLNKSKTSTQLSPPCEHQSRQVPRSVSSTLSPAEFVRGPRAAASVLAATNDLPVKCNHPFLGYICKRSGDTQSQNAK